ncbi:SusC/RagA family TonB-linked outer membrane protein [Pedobacter sp. SD-b]|uniref:SusC/RagA family TonB-linked outer membrane protein n=1 Tax=Pedobacter segetis TaxID=2793069 RepID=A0ABS1BLD4_9SPHI|nr:SusC/RagA family TonB-linked outer membrane protein [Pedobacter segetis]MBK0383705.1 SusC/RagA family TonB-linked outer membrane protein [Pedobacter segetis]
MRIIRYFFMSLCCLSFTLSAEAGSYVGGTVNDKAGIPLSGVTITKKGKSKGVTTGKNGKFIIESETLPVIVTFKATGFKSVTDTLRSDDEMVIMDYDDKLQNVAYGTQTKESVTEAVYSISGDELLTNRSSNLLIALQGRLPGLSILQNNGEPSRESFNAQIRGYDSPNSNKIMYLVDGVERDPSGVSPYDVESVTILKDGAATAMYGMRGSGGVLLITTKKGFNGKSKISVHFDQAIQSPTARPKFVSAADYPLLYNQRVANDTLYADAQDIYKGGTGLDQSNTVFYTPYEIERYQKADQTEFYPVRNVVDDFMKNYSQLSRLNIDFRGGSDLMRYFTSVGYLSQGGLFKNEPFKKYSYDAESKTSRFNFRTNLDISLNKTLNVWANIGGSLAKINRPYVGKGQSWDYVLAKLYETPNNAFNDLTPDGEVLIKRDKLNFRNDQSVYGYLNRSGSSSENAARLYNTFGARQKLDKVLPGLSTSAQLAFDVYSRSTQVRSRNYETWAVATLQDTQGADSLGFQKVGNTSNTTLADGQEKYFYYMYNLRASVDYDHTFARKHHLTGKLLGESYMQQQQDLLASNYIGLAGRLAYGYANKYFAEANFAYQGSEQFAKGKRFGLFPSLSAAWLISQEDFLKNNSKVNFLKIRASVGQTGNTAFAYGANDQYLYLTTWNTNATEDQIGNPNISWETSTKYNLGLDAKLFNSITFGVDVFYHWNDGVIIKDISTVPKGFIGLGKDVSLPPSNIGQLHNKGFEVYAGYNKQFTKDLSLDISGNFSLAQNKYDYVAELPYDSRYAYPFRKTGYSINQFVGYKSVGLFNTQAEIDRSPDQSALGGVPIPGDIKYFDANGDGEINEQDQSVLQIGDAPEISFGFRLQSSWKSFDINVFLNGAARRNVNLTGFGRWSNRDNFTEYMKGAWTAEKFANGEKITSPRLGNNTTNYIMSDYWIVDGSYLRLRNIELGYSLPEKISSKIGASSIRIYTNGLNLLVWDHLPNDDFDPETSNGSNINYPMIKAYNFGLSVKF